MSLPIGPYINFPRVAFLTVAIQAFLCSYKTRVVTCSAAVLGAEGSDLPLLFLGWCLSPTPKLKSALAVSVLLLELPPLPLEQHQSAYFSSPPSHLFVFGLSLDKWRFAAILVSSWGFVYAQSQKI